MNGRTQGHYKNRNGTLTAESIKRLFLGPGILICISIYLFRKGKMFLRYTLITYSVIREGS